MENHPIGAHAVSENRDHASTTATPDAMIIRTVTAADVDEIAALHRDLTDHDRYLRFFALHPAGLDKLAAGLARNDREHYAIGAFTGERCIGIANFTATRGADSADIAVAVASDHHNRGIGTRLLDGIAAVARDRGITTFVADVLAENAAVQQLIAGEGWHLTHHRDGSVTHIVADLIRAERPHRRVASPTAQDLPGCRRTSRRRQPGRVHFISNDARSTARSTNGESAK